jgi:predicted ATPase
LHGKNGESGLCGGDAVAEPVRRYLENCRVYHFNDTGDSAGFKQSPFLTDTAYFYRDGKNLAAFLYMLKTRFPGNYGSIVDSVQTIAPFFHDFFLVPDGTNGDRTILLRWLNKTGEEPFSAQQLSDGTARFICMATLFLQPPHLLPPLVVLDEPELGLHPAAMTVLADIIKSAAKHTRILCTTQSVTFANEFGPECFIVVDQKDGVSTFSRPDSAALDIWLDDYAMGDIWNKSLIGGQPAW